MNLTIVSRNAYALPIGINRYRATHREPPGRADPIWDTAFTTKFSRTPAKDAPLVAPTGAAKVIVAFLDRVAEIHYLTSTQDQELATTRALLAANGLTPADLTPEAEASPLDPVYRATMSRRIDWERYIWHCGGVHRTQFAAKDGVLGIRYDGPDARRPADRLAHQRAHKHEWLDRFGSLPSAQDVAQSRLYAETYPQVVLALMSDANRAEHRASRMYGTEDPDPGRVAFHTVEDPRPVRSLYAYGWCTPRCDPNHTNCSKDGDALFADDLAGWTARQTKPNYAGPSGLLGLDLDALTDDEEDDDPAFS